MQTAKALGCALCTVLVSTHSVASSDWSFKPRLSASTTYTSNLDLSADDEIESMVFELAPGFSLSKQGSRVQSSVAYRARAIHYDSAQGKDRVDHNLGAKLSAELIEQHLFIDTQASYSQQLIDNSAARNDDTLNAARNFTDTATLRITPTWKQRIGDYTNAGISYTYTTVLVDKSDDDSAGSSYNLFLDTERSPSRFAWSFKAGQSNTHSDQSAAIKEDSVSVQLGYRQNPQFVPNIRVGYVDNHLDSPTRQSAEAGSFWGLGVTWKPNPRNTLEASYNSRLQTTSGYGLTYSHQRRHSRWSLSYLESVSSSHQEFSGQLPAAIICPIDTTTLSDCQALIQTQPTDLPQDMVVVATGSIPVSFDFNERFIQRSTKGQVNISKGKTRFNIALFNVERDLQVLRLTQTETGASATWGWTLGKRSNLSTSWSWSRQKSDVNADTYNQRLRLAFSRNLSRKTLFTASLGGSWRNSSDDSRTFDDVSAVISLSKAF